MRDSLNRVSTPLTGSLGTTVNSTAVGLGADGAQNAVGGPVWYGYEIEVSYPNVPTGTAPSIIADVYDSLDGTTFVLAARIHAVLAAATAGTFPGLRARKFFPQRRAKAIRVTYTLNNTDNNFGTVTWALSSGVNSREM